MVLIHEIDADIVVCVVAVELLLCPFLPPVLLGCFFVDILVVLLLLVRVMFLVVIVSLIAISRVFLASIFS